MNEKTDPVVSVALGTVRLRLVNAANARVLAFRLGGNIPMRVVALDGAPCDPFDLQKIRVAPAQRADLVFVADNPGMWLLHCHMMEHHAAGMGAVISIT